MTARASQLAGMRHQHALTPVARETMTACACLSRLRLASSSPAPSRFPLTPRFRLSFLLELTPPSESKSTLCDVLVGRANCDTHSFSPASSCSLRPKQSPAACAAPEAAACPAAPPVALNQQRSRAADALAPSPRHACVERRELTGPVGTSQVTAPSASAPDSADTAERERGRARPARTADTLWHRRPTRAPLPGLRTHVRGGDGCRG